MAEKQIYYARKSAPPTPEEDDNGNNNVGIATTPVPPESEPPVPPPPPPSASSRQNKGSGFAAESDESTQHKDGDQIPMDHDGLSFQDRIDRFEKVLEAFEQQNNEAEANKGERENLPPTKTDVAAESATAAAANTNEPKGIIDRRESLADKTNKNSRPANRSRSSSTSSRSDNDTAAKPFPYLKKGGGVGKRASTASSSPSPNINSTSADAENSDSDQLGPTTGKETTKSKGDGRTKNAGGTRKNARTSRKKLPPIPKFPKFPNPPLPPAATDNSDDAAANSKIAENEENAENERENLGEKEKISDDSSNANRDGPSNVTAASGYQRPRKEPHVCMDITSFRFIPEDGKRVDMVLKKIVGDRIGKTSDAFRDNEQEEIHNLPTIYSNEVTGVPLQDAPGAATTVDDRKFLTLAEFASKRAPLTQTFRSIPKKEIVPFVLIYKDERKVLTEYRWENPDHQRSADFINEVLCSMYEKDDHCHYAYQRTGK